MRTFLIFAISFVGHLHVSAQTDVTKGLYPKIVKRNLVSIYTAIGLSQKAKINPESGEYRVTSTAQPAGEIGLNAQCDLNNNLFFVTGFTLTIAGRNAAADVPAHQINPIYPDPFPLMEISDADFCATIPFEIEKDWQLEKSKIIYGRIGLNLKYSFGYDEDIVDNYLYDPNNQRINVFSLELNSNNHNKPWFTYIISGGYGWTLRNHNLMKLGLVANISLTKFVSGRYEVNIPGDPLTEGSYGVTGSYIALSFNYVFVRFQKL
ncbi:MAG TPA: hypothetical protein VGQ53_03810 [Chitinophagaceae bacterium]|jgi:hypothetical protein|nr:hypothetical protein [Chitinophagaceae bacterium]